VVEGAVRGDLRSGRFQEAGKEQGIAAVLGRSEAVRHRLICGDAPDPGTVDLLMAGERARMVFTDPPWNVPVYGHVGRLGRTRHREFAMASGEMSVSEFMAFLQTASASQVRHGIDGAIHFICMDWRRRRNGLPLPEPLPHPDDVFVDMNTGTARFAGPMTSGQVGDREIMRAEKARVPEGYKLFTQLLSDPANAAQHATFSKAPREIEERLDPARQVIPDRVRSFANDLGLSAAFSTRLAVAGEKI